MASTDIIYMKRGDTLPVLTRTLKYSDGTAVNLTGATVLFQARAKSVPGVTAGTVVISAACSVTNATTGAVSYAWQEDDTMSAGEYEAEFQATFPSGVLSVPTLGFLRMTIGEDVA